MPNGEQKVKPWNDIAKDFDPMMPASMYDGLRLKYFQDFVQPKIAKGKSAAGTWEEFKKATDRPDLLGPGGRAVLHTKIAAASAASAMLEPIRDAAPITKKLFDDVQKKQLTLTTLAEREGMNTTVPQVAGSFAGQAVDFGVLTAVTGPVAGAIAGEMAESAKAVDLFFLA